MNFKATYLRPDGIIPTDCYAGCTGITHIDDVEVVPQYVGDIALYYIPMDWGGSDLTNTELEDYYGIYEIEIPTDNYTVTCKGDLESRCNNSTGIPESDYYENMFIDWGDGTIDTSVSFGDTHTYVIAGTYIFKGNIIIGKKGLPLRNILKRVLKHPKIINNSQTSYWKNCDKMIEFNASNWDMSNVISLAGAFENCTSLPSRPINNIPDSVTDISRMYYGWSADIMEDISGMTFGSGITTADNWMGEDKTVIKYAN